ncbi:MAG: hypothetical protein ABGU93_15785 [Acetobacterium sp.]|uniref:hypothetical protein n=1 Tax=Acetobacterium sp. TaxID=1872094 RepID=UPI003242C7A8
MEIIKWLLAGDPYVAYATRKNLLNLPDHDLVDLKKMVLHDARIKKQLGAVANFSGTEVSNHKNPDLPIHLLMFLLDIGLNREVPEIDQAIRQIMGTADENGVYRSVVKVPKSYGGTGEETLGWFFCDAPLMHLALLRAGVSYQEQLKPGVDFLVGLQRENGFPCAVSQELGQWRGPGKKADPCPYANLVMLRLLAMIPEYVSSRVAGIAIEALLSQWENSRESHPYLFYMGTDFRKLKAPAIWFDLVTVCDCLSQYPQARSDQRFAEMLALLEAKANEQNQFTPESIYLKCKLWDFGQKKQPSPWLTYLCLQILKRCGRFAELVEG